MFAHKSTGESDVLLPKLVFRHDANGGYFSTIAEANSSNATSATPELESKFSIFDELEGYRHEGKFYFRAVWPNIGEVFEWEQTSNPVTNAPNTVDGFILHSSTTSDPNFLGLALSSATSTFYDMSPASTSWWYAVASKLAYYGPFMPAIQQGAITTDIIEIYVLSGPPEAEESEVMTTSVYSVTYPTPTSIQGDGRLSEYDGSPNGGNFGEHKISIATIEHLLDIYAPTTAASMVAGTNVAADASGVYFTKLTADNSWNAYCYSDQPVILAGEDAAVSWVIEHDFDNDGDDGDDGTIREMGGLSYSPTSNASYTGIDFAMYQVNATTIYVYEKGSNKGAFPVAISVGDRLMVKVQENSETGAREVHYLHISGSVETLIYKSTKTAGNTDLFFKGAINRGVGQSGHGTIGDVQIHNTLKPQPVAAHIFGSATEQVREDDAEKLLGVGLEVLTGSTYALMMAERTVSSQFPVGTVHDFTHAYGVMGSQSVLSGV